MSDIPIITMDALRRRYPALLLDAYGVLIHGYGPIPGAAELIRTLNRAGHRYLVVTNDASRMPETAARRYAMLGLEIPAENVLTSGSLIAPCFRELGLDGARCAVLGPPDSVRYVEQAGGRPVPAGDPFDVLVVGDESAIEPFLDVINAVLTALLRRIDAGAMVHLLLPNPDLLYPRGDGVVGVTSGAIAAVFEAVLAERYPDRDDLRFRRLGKPGPALFTEAIQRTGTPDVVMIGDQLATDIAGANRAGIDSALFVRGISGSTVATDGPRPRYLLESLA